MENMENMSEQQFEEMAKAAVVGYYNNVVRKEDDPELETDKVVLIWKQKTTYGHLALILTEKTYYDVCYDAEQDAFYLTPYKRGNTVCIPVEREVDETDGERTQDEAD